jgi:uncharacterized membrane protein YphA (DoxX/SURF4 family)
MNKLAATGRWFFAIAIGGFGIQQLIYKGFVPGVTIVPDWTPAHTFWAYATGALLVVCAISIVLREKAQLASLVTGMLFLIIVLILHLPRVSAIIHANSAERTRAFETLALCGGALILAGAMQEARLGSSLSAKITAAAAESGRLLFAFSLVVFGIDHIPAARFVATLVPAWIPWHLSWADFTAAALLPRDYQSPPAFRCVFQRHFSD